jgi:mRNA interferase MazF
MTRGEVWWADFGIPFGTEPGFKRPVLVIQDDDFNRSNIGTVVIVPFTTNLALADAPGNVFLEAGDSGLAKDSVLVNSQITAIDKKRLVERVSRVESRYFGEIEEGIRIVLGMKKFA